MTERIFHRTCSCGKRIGPGEVCPCKPPRTFPKQSERERLTRDPSRAGYRDPAYRKARAVAIRRATIGGAIHCEGCGITVGLRRDRRGRVADYQTHHRDGDPTNNPPDGSNLMVLCEGKTSNRCHERADAELRRMRRRGGA